MATNRTTRDKVPLPIVLLLSPFFILYGVFLLLRSPVWVWRRVRGFIAAMRSSVVCSTCGTRNAVQGRWTCARCHGDYLGWVGHCGICGAGAGWFRCTACATSIRLPWVSP